MHIHNVALRFEIRDKHGQIADLSKINLWEVIVGIQNLYFLFPFQAFGFNCTPTGHEFFFDMKRRWQWIRTNTAPWSGDMTIEQDIEGPFDVGVVDRIGKLVTRMLEVAVLEGGLSVAVTVQSKDVVHA